MSIDLDFTIGLPPQTRLTEKLIKGTMPLAEITPMVPEFQKGMNLFTLTSKIEDYRTLLETHGYKLKGERLKVAFLADNFPTDSFSNEYGETFLDKYVQAASSGVSDLTQMFGASDISGLLRGVEGAAGKTSLIASMAGFAAENINKMKDNLNKAANKRKGTMAGSMLSSLALTADAIAAGQRVDFPMVWKNSGFSPSYTMTIRLYNPNPRSKEVTKKYIIGPLTALLLLGLPRTKTKGATYTWPFFTKVVAPGIYNLQASCITSISVVKGGDNQNISWNQRLGIVDVRLDFGSLYGSIVVDENATINSQRPTLASYTDALLQGRDAPNAYDNPLSQDGLLTSDTTFSSQQSNEPKGISQQVADPSAGAQPRASTTKVATAQNLIQSNNQVYTEYTLST